MNELVHTWRITMVRKISYRFALIGISTWMIAGVGCSTLDPHQSDFARTALGKADYERAFAACEKVMRGEFGQLNANKELSIIEAKPQEYEGKSPGLAKAPMRRVATLRLGQKHRQWWAYIQIQIERYDTQTYQAFHYQRTGQEYGAPTPMESDTSGAVSRRQVWTKVRRQRDLENQLLARIRDELGIQIRKPE
jgi:hypothetical protein